MSEADVTRTKFPGLIFENGPLRDVGDLRPHLHGLLHAVDLEGPRGRELDRRSRLGRRRRGGHDTVEGEDRPGMRLGAELLPDAPVAHFDPVLKDAASTSTRADVPGPLRFFGSAFTEPLT
ncbi:MAG: hypothetical protein LC780_06125 [Acidobacteria bacterium]|nr:hypothetical protein [Acidobacteriota bacterium]